MFESIGADIKAHLQQTPGRPRARLIALLSSQGFWAVAAYRVGRWAHAGGSVQQRLVRPLYAVAFKLIETATRIRLPARAQIGPGLFVANIGPIIISPHARLGACCNIGNDVTVGVVGRGAPAVAPRIGDRVTLAPGAKVIGPVVVGDDAVIGPNSVVVKNVPARVRVIGVPARLL